MDLLCLILLIIFGVIIFFSIIFYFIFKKQLFNLNNIINTNYQDMYNVMKEIIDIYKENEIDIKDFYDKTETRDVIETFYKIEKDNINNESINKKISKYNESLLIYKKIYNDNVLKYNNLVLMFPSSLVAFIKGYKEKKYFRNNY